MKAPNRPGAGADGGDAANLAKPRALAFDASGNVVVADSKNNRLWVQKPTGELLKKVGKLGTGEGQFREPCGVAVGKDGSVYVADTFFTLDEKGGLPWGRIQKFNKDYKFKMVFPKPEGAGDLFGPRGIGVDPSGNVWVSDTGNHRLLKYDADGKLLAAYGKRGKGKVEFVEPFGLAFDAQGRVYVADRLNYRVEILDTNGQYQGEIKLPGVWEDTQINVEPYLAVDSQRGFLYVSDPTKKKVHRYKLDGSGHKEYTRFEGGEFSQPTGLALAADGSLLVSDGNLARVVTLKP
jgi:sugar lactone lactonase YvrE